ncbi:MAG: hypothetical protein IBX64_10875, partial [Actinobacteria bacterium]|nr:hypothetical protein [Actinomycetota bacterium]
MNKERRNNLKNVITKARRLLEEDIAKVITRYGILAGGKRLTPDELSLDPQARETRERIDKAIDKERIGGLSLADATDRYVREVSFTSINRLSALRAMEVRGLLSKETVMRRPEYGGRSLRERDIAEGNPTLSPDEVLNEALLKGFRDVGQEIQVLFDVDNEYSLVKPNPKATRELIRLLTEDVTTDDWAQDDIIGWIYQYFNEEARVEFKRSGRKPGADDIIVTNQFYTPHWVVRALTDNTLGRIWLEMKDRCPYLIPESDDPKAPAKVVEKR